jgi:hypothetical protein
MNAISYINGDEQITDIAELHRRLAPGDTPDIGPMGTAPPAPRGRSVRR